MLVNTLLLKELQKMECGESIGLETRELQVRVETQLSRFGKSSFSIFIPEFISIDEPLRL